MWSKEFVLAYMIQAYAKVSEEEFITEKHTLSKAII